MLNRHIQSKVSSKLALIECWIILDDVNGDFSSILRPFCLSEIDDLHARPTIHLHKQGSNQVPGLSEVLMLDRDMELPIRCLMTELILGVPVHSAMLGVQLDEAIVAESLVITTLRY